MRNLLLLVLFITVFALQSSAQKINWGGKAGISLNNRSEYATQDMYEGKSILTLQASVFALSPLGKSFVFQPSLGYYGKGNQVNDIPLIDAQGNIAGMMDILVRYNYIELALPVQYKIPAGEKFNVLVGAGPYVSYAISGVSKIKNFDGAPTVQIPKKNKMNFGEGLPRVDAGFVVMLSLQIHKKWMVSFNYDQGLTPTQTQTDYEAKNFGGGVTLGYIFK